MADLRQRKKEAQATEKVENDVLKETDRAENADPNEEPSTESSDGDDDSQMNLCCVIFGVLMAVGMLVVFLTQPQPSDFQRMPDLVLLHFEEGHMVPNYDASGQRVDLFTREEGPRDGEVVLLLHGVPTSSFLYRHVIGPLASRGLRVIAVDLPGMGLSQKPDDTEYTWKYMADAVNGLVNTMDLEDGVHLVLHDVAGPIGLEFAIQFPAKVRSITVSNALLDVEGFRKPFPMGLFTVPYVRNALFAALQNPLLGRVSCLVTQWISSTSMTLEACQAHYYLLSHNEGKKAFLSLMRSFDTSAEHAAYLKEGLHALHGGGIPFQTIWSEQDLLVSHAEFLAHHVPLARQHTLSGKHFIQEDQPLDFAKHVADFVASLPPTVRKVPEPEEIPPHILKQMQEGGGHSHGHGHGGHGHAHGGHGHSH